MLKLKSILSTTKLITSSFSAGRRSIQDISKMSIEKEVNKDGIAYLTLNQPTKLNAFTTQMLADLCCHMNDCNQDDNVHTIVLTGRGKFFTSGNDQRNLTWAKKTEEESKPEVESFVKIVDDLCKSLIDNSKIFIVGINGPAVGLGLTVLGHADYVFALASSYLWSPFTMIGIPPEMCSTFTIPNIVGTQNAKRILIFSQKITAKEALEMGIVSKLIHLDQTDQGKLDGNEFQVKLRDAVDELLKPVSRNGMKTVQKLMRSEDEIRKLHETREKERKLLLQTLASEEVKNYASKFLAKEAK